MLHTELCVGYANDSGRLFTVSVTALVPFQRHRIENHQETKKQHSF